MPWQRFVSGFPAVRGGPSLRLGEKVYQLIRHKIVVLELPPLSPIDEQALTEDLELGSIPIGEAL